MKVRFLLICWLCITFSGKTNAQESPAYQSKWQTTAMVGINFPGSKLLQGIEYDNLVGYNDNSYYWQLLSISYFFHRHWGAELNYQGCASDRIRKRNDIFQSNINSKYKDKHYISSTGIAVSDDVNIILGDFSRGHFGVIYRYETDKFYLYPKLSIGVFSFETNWASAYLKEKGSNRQYKYRYSTGEKPAKDYFSMASTLSFGYKLHSRIFLNAELMCSYFKPDFTYERIFEDLYTKESITDTYTYRKNIFSFSAGLGLRVIIH